MFSYIKKVLPSQRQRIWFGVVLIALLIFYPYELADAYLPFIKTNSITVLVLLAALIPLTFLSNPKRMPWPFTLCVSLLIVGSLIHFIHSGDKYYYHRVVMLLYAICLTIIVYSKIGFKQFYNLYNRWIVIMLIGCFVGVILSFVGLPPLHEFIASNDDRVVSSWIVTFTKNYIEAGSFIRPSGFFDEPGAMGYFSCFAIAYNRLLVRDKRIEWILLVLSLFTFSFGYIMQATVYILLFVVFNKSVKGKIWLIIVFTVVIIGLNVTKGTQYNDIYENTIGKIESLYNTENVLSLETTSRETLVESGKYAFEQNPVWGIGWKMEDTQYGRVSDSIYETLARDGIIGFLYTYFPYLLLLFWGIKRKDMDVVSVVVFLVLSLFHRPLHAYPLNYFIYYSLPIVYYLKAREENFEQKWIQRNGLMINIKK